MKTYYFNIMVDSIQANSEKEAAAILQQMIARGEYEIELDDVDG